MIEAVGPMEPPPQPWRGVVEEMHVGVDKTERLWHRIVGRVRQRRFVPVHGGHRTGRECHDLATTGLPMFAGGSVWLWSSSSGLASSRFFATAKNGWRWCGLDHREPPPGGDDGVALTGVRLLADEQLVARGLPGGQVTTGGLPWRLLLNLLGVFVMMLSE